MAVRLQCDFCGEDITNDHLKVTIDARGHAYDPDGIWGDGDERHTWVGDPVGHYHADADRQCWSEMLDRIALIHDVSSKLGPDAQELERRRAKHEQRRTDQVATQERKDREHDGWRALEDRRDEWRRRSWAEREQLLLEVLGDGRLTVSELAAGLNAKFGWPTEYRRHVGSTPLDHPPIDRENVRPVAMRLLDRGALNRFNGPHNNRAAVWHFYRDQAKEA